jgi:hypothetical protein
VNPEDPANFGFTEPVKTAQDEGFYTRERWANLRRCTTMKCEKSLQQALSGNATPLPSSWDLDAPVYPFSVKPEKNLSQMVLTVWDTRGTPYDKTKPRLQAVWLSRGVRIPGLNFERSISIGEMTILVSQSRAWLPDDIGSVLFD